MPAAQRAADVLRQELLDGAWSPGARLREEALAARFGVGRYTVRSALQRLESDGLIRHDVNKGAFVPELTRDRIDELCDYRAVIELGGLRLALGRGADLDPVEQAVAALEALPDTTPWHEATTAHREIHHAIVAASGNPRLIATYRLAEDELQLMIAFTAPDISVPELARRHRDLMTALVAGGEDAVAALRDDLEFTGRTNLLSAVHRRH